MTQSNDSLETAIERLLAGEATPAERALVEQHAATDPGVARLVASLSAEFSAASAGWATDAAWSRLQGRIHGGNGSAERSRDISSAPSQRKAAARRAVRTTLLRIAAAVLVVLSASSVWRFVSEHLHTAGMARVFATTKGQRATFVLADGSRVMLDVDSRMRVHVSRTDGSRDVYLDGEAFFQVKHDAARPFNVHAAGAVTRVLGTEFDVRAYPGARAVFVAVRSGAVSLRPESDPAAGVLLTRGQLGSIDSLGGAKVHAGMSAEALLGWTTGNLVLSDVTVREAADQLARWYDARIVVDDQTLGMRRVNATFRDEPVTQALEALALSLRAHVTRTGTTFHISAGRGGP